MTRLDLCSLCGQKKKTADIDLPDAPRVKKINTPKPDSLKTAIDTKRQSRKVK